MSDTAITKASRKFYELFQFPGQRPVDRDGLIFLRRLSKSIETLTGSNAGLKLRILDAGCGTGNTCVSLARQFQDVEFFGIDNSRRSLEKARSLLEQEGLTNLHLRRWNLMNPLPFRKQFDIILCLGVLHHTADMKKGLINLQRQLKTGGELYLWVYGRHGRYRHALNMRLLKVLLRSEPDTEARLKLAKEFVRGFDGGSAMLDLLGRTRAGLVRNEVLDDPVWIADQFLNPHEILVDMTDLLKLARTSGLEIEQFLGFDNDVSKRLNSPPLVEKFGRLGKSDRLIALDLMVKPERYFVVLRKLSGRKAPR